MPVPSAKTPKQAELNRLLSTAVKSDAKARGWRVIAGQAYWRADPLLFTTLPLALARQRSMSFSLRFKWLHLDHRLWEVLGMDANAEAPFSLHANGAFTVAGHDAMESRIEDCEWTPEWLQQQVTEFDTAAAARAAELSRQITTIDAYHDEVRRGHEAIMKRYPNARVDIWQETLLVALERGDRKRAVEIARERIAAGDSGTFIVGGRTFYECAVDYLGRV